jgi:intracellular septation protein
MKFLFEMFPIILFFAAYKFKGIYVATAVAIAASILQISYTYYKNKKVEKPMIISLVIIIIFGGATLLVHNELFIKWKPTVLYWIFASALLIGRYVFNKNFIQSMLQKQITVPVHVWEKLNTSWAVFFAAVGGLNIYIAYHFSTDIWVNFKLFGIFGCMLIFVIIQSIILAPHMKDAAEKAE